MRFVCAFLLLFLVNNGSLICINVEDEGQELPQFWKSTGFSPADPKLEHFLSEEELVNVALIGALPHNGIQHIRVHWLLNLIRYTNGQLNFTKLDTFMDWVHEQRLSPGFEIMGIPENLTPDQIRKMPTFWYDLVREIASRYLDRYGVGVVSRWRFETWNEPDLKIYNTNHFTLQEYLDYVFSCHLGLDAALGAYRETHGRGSDVPLKFGGPAGLFKRREAHPLCWGLLDKCSNLPNNSCPLQYISFHKKGGGSAANVFNQDLELIDLLHRKYPGLKHIPIANDEADILVNWSKDEEWRGDTRYAAMVAKVIIDHYKEVVLKRGVKIEVLSNDNGFLNYHPHYFTQRTLFARFQMNHTNPPHVQFVTKPVYAVMGLLSLLGELHVKEKVHASNPLISTLSSRDSLGTTFTTLITYVNDTAENDTVIILNVTFENLPRNDCKYVVYRLDNKVSNPFLLWKSFGSPPFPDMDMRAGMRRVQAPSSCHPSSAGPQPTILLPLTLPAAALVQVCCPRKDLPPPGRAARLRALNVTRNEALLIWQDSKVNSKCIKTYEVVFSPSCGAPGTFRRVNPDDTIFLSYHHSAAGAEGCDGAAGRYKVRAVDYFNRPGRYSKVINYPN